MNRIPTYLFVVTLCLSCASAGLANEPNEIAETYLSSLVSGDPGGGFMKLMKHSDLDEMKPRELQLLSGQIDQAISLYEKPIRFESVKSSSYGRSLARLVYLTIHPDLPLSWEFTFYKSKGPWKLVNIQFKDSFDLLD